MIMTDTRAAMDGMVTIMGIMVIMRRITGIITGAITRVITRAITSIIIHNRCHAERALRKISTITITITTTGGTFGNDESRAENNLRQ